MLNCGRKSAPTFLLSYLCHWKRLLFKILFSIFLNKTGGMHGNSLSSYLYSCIYSHSRHICKTWKRYFLWKGLAFSFFGKYISLCLNMCIDSYASPPLKTGCRIEPTSPHNFSHWPNSDAHSYLYLLSTIHKGNLLSWESAKFKTVCVCVCFKE